MITLEPIGFVSSPRDDTSDDYWGDVEARIELLPEFGPEAFDGIEAFSHVEVTFFSIVFPKIVWSVAPDTLAVISRGRGLVFSHSVARTVPTGLVSRWRD
jgi:tRNA (Thr-GGU) A37 N-methylase